MTFNEDTCDKLLQINTSGRDDSNSDNHRFPYEPTPYTVLERLADSGFFGQNERVLDYGCGKGRVGFFLSFRTKASVIGIEYDERIYKIALENQKTAVKNAKADFVFSKAEDYKVPADVNKCYFFNPFSVEILKSVLARITESYYEAPREIYLFFYYPSDEYMCCLAAADEFEFYDEIDCTDLFSGNDRRERIMIFRLPMME